jgi:pre-mRNA cleavage complex 2 protein Pcf11
VLQEHNQAAVDRLLTVTNLTKSSFLDRLFLRRQKHSSGIHASRLWYVDLDLWMAGTTGSGAAPPPGDVAGGGAHATGGAPSLEQRYSVVADDEQPHCALSGEKFDQFWDEDHQEWRYRDAKKLSAEEAASYNLAEGAIVLVSALGAGPPMAAVGAGVSGDQVKKEEKKVKEEIGQGADAKIEEEEEEPAQKRIKRET